MDVLSDVHATWIHTAISRLRLSCVYTNDNLKSSVYYSSGIKREKKEKTTYRTNVMQYDLVKQSRCCDYCQRQHAYVYCLHHHPCTNHAENGNVIHMGTNRHRRMYGSIRSCILDGVEPYAIHCHHGQIDISRHTCIRQFL